MVKCLTYRHNNEGWITIMRDGSNGGVSDSIGDRILPDTSTDENPQKRTVPESIQGFRGAVVFEPSVAGGGAIEYSYVMRV